MLEYYEQRRPEYEAIYAKPERQNDLAWLEQEISKLIAGHRVLEIACGTGYWTRRISKSAQSVFATDASAQLAESAVASCNTSNVQSGVLDAFDLPKSPIFNSVLAGFFFSHVLIEQRRKFLAGIAHALKPGSQVVQFDNRFVAGSSTPISRRTEAGDTFQDRKLSDGSSYEVLKNFPSAESLNSLLSEFCGNVSVRESQYFWLASGELGAN